MNYESESITPLKGEVCTQYTRCGKTGCRCRTGQLHGPYYYRIWREGAKVRKIYVREADVDRVREACATYRELDKALRELRARRQELTQSIRRSCRASDNLVKRVKGEQSGLDVNR
ncbi:MAG TPA: DUF6788 family protein [Capsulimonadaceae bacterium]|jgi:hypothetical protein